MISPKQIRAARALLNWKQSDLAEASGLSLTAINNIENGSANPRAATLEQIALSFKAHRIVFIDGDGVKIDNNITQIFEGENAIQLLFEDILDTFKDGPKSEIMVSGVDENFFLTSAPHTLIEHIKELDVLGVGKKLLSCEGDTNFISSPQAYRWVPKEQFSNLTLFYIYGDKWATIIWDPLQVIIIDHKWLAESYKRQFMFIWDKAIVPYSGGE